MSFRLNRGNQRAEVTDFSSGEALKEKTLKPVSGRELEFKSSAEIAALMLQNEEDYVDKILGNMAEFLTLLKNERFPDIDEETISKLYIQIENIRQVHQINLTDCRKLKKQGSLEYSIAEQFSSLAPFFKVYSGYISNIENVTRYFVEKGDSSKRFLNFVNTQFKATSYRFTGLLEIPVQRLPQYVIFLNALAAAYNAEGDYQTASSVENCAQNMKEAVNIVTNQVRDKVMRAAVVSVQEEVLGGRVQLVDPSRVLLKQGNLRVQYKGKKGDIKIKQFLIVLFNDTLLIINLEAPAHIKKILRLRSMRVENEDTTSFRITDAVDQRVVLIAKSEIERDTWVESVRNAVVDQERTLIGVQIDDETFEKMLSKKIAQLPLVDPKLIQRKLNYETSKEEKANYEAAKEAARANMNSAKASSSEADYAQGYDNSSAAAASGYSSSQDYDYSQEAQYSAQAYGSSQAADYSAYDSSNQSDYSTRTYDSSQADYSTRAYDSSQADYSTGAYDSGYPEAYGTSQANGYAQGYDSSSSAAQYTGYAQDYDNSSQASYYPRPKTSGTTTKSGKTAPKAAYNNAPAAQYRAQDDLSAANYGDEQYYEPESKAARNSGKATTTAYEKPPFTRSGTAPISVSSGTNKSSKPRAAQPIPKTATRPAQGATPKYKFPDPTNRLQF